MLLALHLNREGLSTVHVKGYACKQSVPISYKGP